MGWALVAAAFGVGVLVGLTGVGAGAIMTPVLIVFFGVSLPVAIATDLVFATVTKLVALSFHQRQKSINWALAGRIWWGSIPGALIGVGLVLVMVSREQAGWLLFPLVAIILFTALIFVLRALELEFIEQGVGPARIRWPGFSVIGGFGIGASVSLTSVGAGALGMALLVAVSPPQTRPKDLVGTDLIHAVPIAIIGGLSYGLSGLVSFELLLLMLTGSLPGAIAGSVLTGKLSDRIISGALAGVLLAAAYLLVRF